MTLYNISGNASFQYLKTVKHNLRVSHEHCVSNFQLRRLYKVADVFLSFYFSNYKSTVIITPPKILIQSLPLPVASHFTDYLCQLTGNDTKVYVVVFWNLKSQQKL